MSVSLPLLPACIRRQAVLVVDDSLFQRELMCALLADFGIRHIQQAADGQQALLRLRAQRHALPLLLLDLEMPEMDGIALLQQLAEEQIKPFVIIASGHEASLINTVSSMLEASGMPYLGSLSKPISGAGLWNLMVSQRPLISALPELNSTPNMTPERLAEAIGCGRIQPYYQPKVALQDGRLIGYEALARWIENDGQVIQPAAFIALAQQYGLLRELTIGLLRHILKDLERLDNCQNPPSIALNIDMQLLAERDFADQLIDTVRRTEISPTQLILEVTESALMHDPAVTLGSVGRLRLAGFGLSIDDYGTGFSTLQQLTRLPFTELKIDRTFVAQAQQNLKAHSILHAAIETGRKLSLPCIAEGVETQSDALLLRQLDCYAAQGYLFARPMPAKDLLDWHQQHYQLTALEDWFAV